METKRTPNLLKRIAAIAAFAIPFFFATCGINWATMMHPDEITALRAMDQLLKDGRPDVRSYIYPEGFYVLADIYRRAALAACWLDGLSAQEGCRFRDLDAIRAPMRKSGSPSIRIGRRANAFLVGLCGLFLFLAVRAATGSVAGGLCAAVLAGCSPFVLEHAHYCESDVSFCAGMALAAWLLFEALERRSMLWTAFGAAACGAAFACKYTVAPIVPFCLAVFIAVCAGRLKAAGTAEERRCALRTSAKAAIFSLLAAFLAYVVLTPLLIVDPGLYFSKILNVWGKVHRETATVDLSALDTVPFLRIRYVLRSFGANLKAFGTLHLALTAVSAVVLWAMRRRFRCGAWLLGLLVLFSAFEVFCAPWIRSQEFMPIAMLMATTIAMAAGEASAAAGRSRSSAIRLVVPALCLAACCAVAAGDAFRVASAFSSEDRRDIARHWLEMSANPASRFAAGRYAHPTLRYGRIATADVFDEPENLWNPACERPEHDYFVRQPVLRGRGFISVATGKLHPQYHDGWTNFLSNAILIRQWPLLPGYQTTFAQLPVELWGIVPQGAAFARLAPLGPRATAYRMGPELYDASLGGDWLGPIDAIRTVGARKTVRFVPPPDGRPLFAVTRHAEGRESAKIKWEGCFEPRSREIEPGRADWFIYSPGLLDGFGGIYVHTRVRMRGDDQTSLCLTTITADPVFAAELLARGGSPDRAVALLACAGLPPDLKWAADSALPLPEKFFRDFARIRFGDFSVYPKMAPESGGKGASGADEPLNLESEFPVFFDPGRYRMSFTVPEPSFGKMALLSISFPGASETRFIQGKEMKAGERCIMEAVFDRPTSTHICGTAKKTDAAGGLATLRDLVIEWDPVLTPAPSIDMGGEME